MSSLRINKQNVSGFYFATFTTIHWYYLFDRYNRWDILANSLQYCINHKNLQLYGFVFMLNHIHLLFSSPDSIGFIRDFKRFTTKEIKQSIERNEPDVLRLFLNNDRTFQLWQSTNMSILIENQKVFEQKLHYIEDNPVRKRYVAKPEYWYWSSANSQCNLISVPLDS